jgi:serine phosphatase RsbU (regulator of sigma subunit)
MGTGVPPAVFEPRRLEAVRRIGLVGMDPPDSFQRLVDLAADIVGSPLGFFTVVDDATSWYVASAGVPDEVVSGPVEASFCKYVIESREPLFVEEASSDPTTAGNPAIDSMGVQAWADPDGRVLGSFCVVDTRPRTWSDRDRSIMEVLARSAADEVSRLVVVRREQEAQAAIESARAAADELARQQRDLLARMQHSLLPTRLPSCEGLDVAVRYESAGSTSGLGGDWYDVIELDDGRSALVIADVAGHDAEAVAVMAQLRPSLHVVARRALRPSAVLHELHELMLELDVRRFLTIFYGIWDPASASVTFTSGGHLPPVVSRPDGRCRLATAGRTSLLGVPGIEPGDDEATLELPPGATLTVFTDGLVERPSQSLDEGLEAVTTLVGEHAGSSAQELAGQLMTAARPSSGWQDDVALLVARAR